jgi:hypothetical protein
MTDQPRLVRRRTAPGEPNGNQSGQADCSGATISRCDPPRQRLVLLELAGFSVKVR